MFCIKPYCSRTNFFAWPRLVYQTSLKLRLKLGLFVNKRTWTSFLSSRAQVVHERLGSFTVLDTFHIMPSPPNNHGEMKELCFYPLPPTKDLAISVPESLPILCSIHPYFLLHKLYSRHGKMGQTRLTSNSIDKWPVLTCDPINPTRTWPDLPVLPRLPTLSRLRLRCNFYKIFTYSSLLIVCHSLLATFIFSSYFK